MLENEEKIKKISEIQIAIYNTTYLNGYDVEFLLNQSFFDSIRSQHSLLLMVIQSLSVTTQKIALIIEKFRDYYHESDLTQKGSINCAIAQIYDTYTVTNAEARFFTEIAILGIIKEDEVIDILNRILDYNCELSHQSFLKIIFSLSSFIKGAIGEKEDSGYLLILGKLNQQEVKAFYEYSEKFLDGITISNIYPEDSIEYKIINGTYQLVDYNELNEVLQDNIFQIHYLCESINILHFIALYGPDEFTYFLHLRIADLRTSLSYALSREFILERNNTFYVFIEEVLSCHTISNFECLESLIATHNFTIFEHFLSYIPISHFKNEGLLADLMVSCLRFNNVQFLKMIKDKTKVEYPPIGLLRRKKGLDNIQNNCYLNVIIHLLFSFEFARDFLNERTHWRDWLNKYWKNDLNSVPVNEFLKQIGVKNVSQNTDDINDVILRIFDVLPFSFTSHFLTIFIEEDELYDYGNLIGSAIFIRVNCNAILNEAIKEYFNKRYIIKAPSILFVTINRNIDGNDVKNDDEISFNFSLDMLALCPKCSELNNNKQMVYELHSIILHKGNDSSGHYSIILKDMKRYIIFSDKIVNHIQAPDKGIEILKNSHTFVYIMVSPDSITQRPNLPFSQGPIANEGLFHHYFDVEKDLTPKEPRQKQNTRTLLRSLNEFVDLSKVVVLLPSCPQLFVTKPSDTQLPEVWEFFDNKMNNRPIMLTKIQESKVEFESLGIKDFILVGTNPIMFNAFYDLIKSTIEKPNKRGKGYSISYKMKIFLFFFHLRTGCTLDEIEAIFGHKRSTVDRAFKYLMDKSDEICKICVIWKNKEELEHFPHFPEAYYVVDSTSNEIFRPSDQKSYYSGKSKSHVMKAQTIHDSKGLCLDIYYAKGAEHDKSIFDNSPVLTKIKNENCAILMDSGYQGTQNMLGASAIFPIRKQGITRTVVERELNKILAMDRIIVENFYGRLHSIFRALADMVWRIAPDDWKPRFTWSACFTNFNVAVSGLRNDRIEMIDISV